jgi:hypothetical protein
MRNSLQSPTVQLVAGLLLGAAVLAAFAIGQDLGSALVSGALVVAFGVSSSTSAAAAATRCWSWAASATSAPATSTRAPLPRRS